MKTIAKKILVFSWVALIGCSGSEAKNAEPKLSSAQRGGDTAEPATEPQAALSSEKSADQTPPPQTLQQNTAVLMVIAPNNFRDEELFVTREILENGGYKITLASTATEEATGMLGGKATPDIALSEAKAENFRAVVFVGGSGTKAILNDEAALKLAKDAAGAGKLVAAICMAPEILANAGLLDGKKATCWSGGQGHIKEKGAEVVNQPVVEDGLIITGSGPTAAKAFGEAIVELLGKDQ